MKQDTHIASPGRLVTLGEIVGTHGVRGLLRYHSYDRASDLPPTGRSVYLTATRPVSPDAPEPAPSRAIVLDDARPHGNVALLAVRGIHTIEAATPLVGHALALPEADLPAPAANEYYVYQLAGLTVVTEAGEAIGTVERSFSNGANEVLVVRDGTREHLIPLIADVVRTVDVAGGRMVIDPIPGLLDA